MSGRNPNPRNGSVHRHVHMSSSVLAGGAHKPVSRNNFNLEQHDDDYEKRFRRHPSFSGHSSQTQKTWEASSSFSSPKLKKNTTPTMRRQKTHPELLNRDQWRHTGFMNNPVDQSLSATKLLVNVTVGESIGPLRALLSQDATVEDVIKVTLVLYAKEGRKPLLSNDPTSFGLHYSQFNINRLNPGDNVKDLGSSTFKIVPVRSKLLQWHRLRRRVSWPRAHPSVYEGLRKIARYRMKTSVTRAA